MPHSKLTDTIERRTEDLYVGQIGNHLVTLQRTSWNTWEGTAWPDGGEATVYLRGDTMHGVREAITHRLEARI